MSPAEIYQTFIQTAKAQGFHFQMTQNGQAKLTFWPKGFLKKAKIVRDPQSLTTCMEKAIPEMKQPTPLGEPMALIAA